jgi:hypothetical protein
MNKKEIEKLDEEWIKETGCEESEDFVIAAFKGETPEVIKRLHHRDHQILELVKGEAEKLKAKAGEKSIEKWSIASATWNTAIEKVKERIDEIAKEVRKALVSLLPEEKPAGKLVIEVLTTAWGKLWRVKEQTFIGNQFNNGSYEFRASNNFIIGSSGWPQNIEDGIMVMGNNETRNNEVGIVVSEEWLESLRVAVKEYNASQRLKQSAFVGCENHINDGIEIIQ